MKKYTSMILLRKRWMLLSSPKLKAKRSSLLLNKKGRKLKNQRIQNLIITKEKGVLIRLRYG